MGDDGQTLDRISSSRVPYATDPIKVTNTSYSDAAALASFCAKTYRVRGIAVGEERPLVCNPPEP